MAEEGNDPTQPPNPEEDNDPEQSPIPEEDNDPAQPPNPEEDNEPAQPEVQAPPGSWALLYPPLVKARDTIPNTTVDPLGGLEDAQAYFGDPYDFFKADEEAQRKAAEKAAKRAAKLAAKGIDPERYLKKQLRDRPFVAPDLSYERAHDIRRDQPVEPQIEEYWELKDPTKKKSDKNPLVKKFRDVPQYLPYMEPQDPNDPDSTMIKKWRDIAPELYHSVRSLVPRLEDGGQLDVHGLVRMHTEPDIILAAPFDPQAKPAPEKPRVHPIVFNDWVEYRKRLYSFKILAWTELLDESNGATLLFRHRIIELLDKQLRYGERNYTDTVYPVVGWAKWRTFIELRDRKKFDRYTDEKAFAEGFDRDRPGQYDIEPIRLDEVHNLAEYGRGVCLALVDSGQTAEQAQEDTRRYVTHPGQFAVTSLISDYAFDIHAFPTNVLLMCFYYPMNANGENEFMIWIRVDCIVDKDNPSYDVIGLCGAPDIDAGATEEAPDPDAGATEEELLYDLRNTVLFRCNGVEKTDRIGFLVSKDSLFVVFGVSEDSAVNSLLKPSTFVVMECNSNTHLVRQQYSTETNSCFVSKGLTDEEWEDPTPYAHKLVVVGEGVNAMGVDWHSALKLNRTVRFYPNDPTHAPPSVLDWYQFHNDFARNEDELLFHPFQKYMAYEDITDRHHLYSRTLQIHLVVSIYAPSLYTATDGFTDRFNIFLLISAGTRNKPNTPLIKDGTYMYLSSLVVNYVSTYIPTTGQYGLFVSDFSMQMPPFELDAQHQTSWHEYIPANQLNEVATYLQNPEQLGTRFWQTIGRLTSERFFNQGSYTKQRFALINSHGLVFAPAGN